MDFNLGWRGERREDGPFSFKIVVSNFEKIYRGLWHGSFAPTSPPSLGGLKPKLAALICDPIIRRYDSETFWPFSSFVFSSEGSL